MAITRSQDRTQPQTKPQARSTMTERKLKKDVRPTQVGRHSSRRNGQKRIRYHPVKPLMRIKVINKVKEKYTRGFAPILGYRPVLSKGADLKASTDRIRVLMRLRRRMNKRKAHGKYLVYPDADRVASEPLRFLASLHVPILPTHSSTWSLQRSAIDCSSEATRSCS